MTILVTLRFLGARNANPAAASTIPSITHCTISRPVSIPVVKSAAHSGWVGWQFTQQNRREPCRERDNARKCCLEVGVQRDGLNSLAEKTWDFPGSGPAKNIQPAAPCG